jgi:hypothetical protein
MIISSSDPVPVGVFGLAGPHCAAAIDAKVKVAKIARQIRAIFISILQRVKRNKTRT